MRRQSLPDKFNELTIWATARCNMACDYCFVYKGYGTQPNADLQDDVIDALPLFCLKYLQPNGSIHFFGGEPLVALDKIKKVYEKVHAVAPSVRFGLTTNVSLLTEETAMWLGDRHFYVLLSVDGGEKSHNTHRKYPDGRPTWKEVWEGVQNTRLYIGDMTLRWTVTTETVGNIAEDVKFYLKNGFRSIALEFNYEEEWSEKSLNMLASELAESGKYILRLTKNNVRVNFKPIDDLIGLLRQDQNSWMHRCGLAEGGVGVDVNGDIYPCHRYVGERKPDKVIGNIKTGVDFEKRRRIGEVWCSMRPQNKEDVERCMDCPLAGRCMGGCLAVNSMYGDPHFPPKCYCNIEKVKFYSLFDVAMKISGMMSGGPR
jgi:uncharacterized protein